MNSMTITTNSVQTMTSKEIAALVESRHDSVKRTIERLVEAGAISQPPLVDGDKSPNGVVEKLYNIGKRDSYVIVAQLSPQFTARLVDRWQELEEKQREVMPKLPKTYAEALLEAGRLALELEQANETIAISAPKVNVFDRVIERETLLNATQVATQVGMSATKMNRALDDIGGVYNKSVKRGRVFCQKWIDNGHGEMKLGESGHPQALFTTQGSVKVVEMFTSEGII